VELTEKPIHNIPLGNFCESGLVLLHTCYRAFNQEGDFQRKPKSAISPQMLVLLTKLFSEISDYSSTITLTQNSKFEENCRCEGKQQPQAYIQ